jgi:hypothetical protein
MKRERGRACVRCFLSLFFYPLYQWNAIFRSELFRFQKELIL